MSLFSGLFGAYEGQRNQQQWSADQARMQQESFLRHQQAMRDVGIEQMTRLHEAMRQKENAPNKWGEFEDAEIIEDSRALEHK
jgi:hypothetical protein